MQISKGMKFYLLVAGIFLFSYNTVIAQLVNDTTGLYYFIKKEINTGVIFSVVNEREELRTAKSREYQEMLSGNARFRLANRNWIYLPYLQEQWDYAFEVGPVIGKGDLIDSSASRVIDAEHKLAGISGKAKAAYAARFYFDQKNFTLISVNAWARYDLYRRSKEGTLVDSNQVSFLYDEQTDRTKLLYGIEAKAGWGLGRLSPANHYMTASWLLNKYYPGRLFSEGEIVRVAREIGRIKHERNLRAGHSAEHEVEQLWKFINRELLLEPPANTLSDWLHSEFRPRFKGSRFELGPFFNYFSHEPDFVYGGYIQYENEKYCNLNWNRRLSANLRYNSYKKDDWLLLETVLGWSWYPGLKTEYGFGLKYIPGMVVKEIDDFGPVRHNFVPYFEYFTQINSRYRVETAFAWRIVPNEQFMLPGPEFTVSVYRSSY